MRGRLIFQFLAEIAPIDTEEIESTDNYDDVFRTVKKVDSNGDGIGEVQRKEGTLYTIPVQIESNTYNELNPSSMGDIPQYDLVLVMHFKDLERLGKIDASGNATVRKRDRLARILDKKDNVIHDFSNTQMLVVEAKPSSYGLNMSFPRRNLLLVFFRENAQGTTRL